jgi:hypothetical protein
MRNATLLFTGDALAAGANGTGKTFEVDPLQPLAYVQVYIEADALTTSTVTVSLQGRLNSDAAWVTQLMPQMRVVHAAGGGGYAATTGNDVRVWILASGTASRSDS